MKKNDGVGLYLVWKRYRIVFLFFLLFSLLLAADPFAFFTLRLQDALYQIPGQPYAELKIIPAEHHSGSADLRADLASIVETLNADPDMRPAVIGIDIPLYGRSSAKSDAALSQAVAASDNVVLTARLQFEYRLVRRYGRYSTENMHVSGIYPAVPPMDMAPFGFANFAADRDGRVRHGIFSAKYSEQTAYAFPYMLYTVYMRQNGTPKKPPLNLDGMWFVDYRGKPGSYFPEYGWEDILSGKVTPSTWKNKIILLCPDPATQQPLPTPMGLQTPTEVAANMVQGLLQSHQKREIPILIQALIILPLAGACSLLTRRGKWISVLTAVGGWILWPMLCMLLYHLADLILDPFYLPFFVSLLCIYTFASRFLTQTYHRFVTWLILRRYLSPIMRKRLFHEDVSLDKAQKRNIAVLFVDIRGFTPLSESLSPGQLAQVLKEYLTLTSSAIFNNGGTLDKFIGDATMGFFNAPLEQEDYIYHAVKAGLDIISHGQQVRESIYKKFGRNVYFGVGIHCGNAFVGRIGPDYRQDYTAVGDTVNTAARLESSAKSGEVLVSMRVCEMLKGRLQASFVGELPIKGKSRPMMLYRAEELLETAPVPNTPPPLREDTQTS